jgi:hypothetical protein
MPPLPKPSDTEVPPPDLSRIAKERADATKAYRTDLAAAAATRDPAAKATAVAAATDKKRTQDAAINDAEAKERADYNKRLGEWQTKERQRQEDIANKRAEETAKLEQQHRQALELKAVEAKNAQALEDQKARNAANQSYDTARLQVDTDQLKKFGDSATQATKMIRDTRALQQIATGMGPADAMMETDAGKHIRDWLVTMNLGTPESLGNLKNQQAWDRLIGGLFGDTHVAGLGNQTDREGGWLMRAWGGMSQTPLDRLTQLAIVRKLAEERVKDHEDARQLFQDPNVKSLQGLPERIAARKSLFDRPPEDTADTQKQARYNASHAPGEPYYSWAEVGKGSGNWRQFWTRNTLDKAKPVEYLTPDVSQ